VRRNTYLALLAAMAGMLFTGCRTNGDVRQNVEAASAPVVKEAPVLACPGRVETREDPLDIGVGASGVLLRFAVRQNDHVAAGQVLAQVDCADLTAELAQYESEQQVSIRTKERLVVGGRPEDRAAAMAKIRSAEATLVERRAWYERMKGLAAKDVVAKSEFDRAEREWRVAEADLESARQQSRSAAAEPLREDLAKVDAEIRAAGDRIAAAKARLTKCTVTSPISGTVLRTFVTAGEYLSSAYPKIMLTVADLTRLRVRAEVDEQDIGKVRTARRVSVVSDAWPGKEFPATISYEAPVMGRRRTRTGDPAEKSDRDMLDVLVNLDHAAKDLPLGLRVTVQFRR